MAIGKKAKITLQTVRGVSNREYVWDTDVKGFGARGNRDGGVSFLVMKRIKGRLR